MGTGGMPPGVRRAVTRDRPGGHADKRPHARDHIYGGRTVRREKAEKSVLPKHPGLKSETWATHSIFVRAIFILGGPAGLSGEKCGLSSDNPSLDRTARVVVPGTGHFMYLEKPDLSLRSSSIFLHPTASDGAPEVSSIEVVRTDGTDPNRPALLLSSEQSSESGDRCGESRRRDLPGSKECLWHAVGNPPRAGRASALCRQAVRNNSPARQESRRRSACPRQQPTAARTFWRSSEPCIVQYRPTSGINRKFASVACAALTRASRVAKWRWSKYR
jgi:hypothetical protein